MRRLKLIGMEHHDMTPTGMSVHRNFTSSMYNNATRILAAQVGLLRHPPKLFLLLVAKEFDDAIVESVQAMRKFMPVMMNEFIAEQMPADAVGASICWFQVGQAVISHFSWEE